MKIYRPVKTNFITQSFGENKNPTYKQQGLLGHDGIDFWVWCKDGKAKTGGQCENIYCNVEGDGELTVVFIQKDVERGFGVTVMDEMWNKFLWWHEDSFDSLVFLGQKIKPGQLIGVAGNTGNSTGAHVHFGYYPYGEPQNNGYNGAKDPTPYFDNQFILDIEKKIGIIKALISALQALINLIK